MMNRAGIGSLMRAGPAPGRAGLSHLARGEAVIPNAAMRADPSLRQRAMQSMASRGRNPSQFTVGQQNLRNPSTGMPMFADLVYRDGQYVDAATGQPANFGGDTGSFANTGTTYSGPAGFDPATGRVTVGSFGGLPTIKGRQIGETVEFADLSPSGQGMLASFGNPAARGVAPSVLAEPFIQAQQQGITPTPSMSPYFQQNQAADFSSFSQPQTYDQWAQTRNPSGKNMPNTLFGQTQSGGQDAGFSTGGMQMPNVLAGQMPVPGASWGTPGTALGFGRENTANDPSILRSGYNDGSLSQSIYSGAFGAGPQSGIAFSGQNLMNPNQPNQQNQYGGGFGFNSAFKY